DRDKSLDLRSAHQQLHADPGAEGKSCNPATACFRIDRLCPVERGRRIRQFALPVVERTLAAPNAAEIESHHREIAMHERIVELVDDLMIHRAAELRMRMQHDGDWGVLLRRRVIAAFDAAGWAGEDDLGHSFTTSIG